MVLISGVDILDRDDRFHRVDNPEIRNRGNIDADVMAGDDAFGTGSAS